jgi:hypothetical protein
LKANHLVLTFMSLCLVPVLSFRAQETGPRSTAPDRLAPPFAAVRAAWNVPEDQALALVAMPGMTLEEFTVLAVVGHDSRKSPQDLENLRRSGKNWYQVIEDLNGPFWSLVVHGSKRYQLKAMEPAKTGDHPATEADILRLAQVMTLERLTGRGPAAILRELDAGRDYAQLLSPKPEKRASPTSPARDRRDLRNGWPPGLADPGAPPASSGIIDTDGSGHRH